MPCVLLECGFMDSSTDVPIILTEEFADKVASACVEVLVAKGDLKQIALSHISKLSPYFAKYNGASGSIVIALNSLCVDSSFGYRKKIAKKNGISLYCGTAAQNIKMLDLLKSGKLLKP